MAKRPPLTNLKTIKVSKRNSDREIEDAAGQAAARANVTSAAGRITIKVGGKEIQVNKGDNKQTVLGKIKKALLSRQPFPPGRHCYIPTAPPIREGLFLLCG